MARYLLRRLLQSLLLLALVSMIAFAILHLAPGGPLAQFLATGDLGQEDVDRLMEQYGLNRPVPIQYLDWAGNLAHGRLGYLVPGPAAGADRRSACTSGPRSNSWSPRRCLRCSSAA